jgi:hypothetical protein
MYKNRITLKTCIGNKYTYIHTIKSRANLIHEFDVSKFQIERNNNSLDFMLG